MTDQSFDDAFIAEVKAATDIAAMIGRGLKLVKKGREYTACCPFHSEKTASFKVNPDKGFYHCFGCGAHGDAVDYLRQTQNMTFAEAIEFLASEAGLSSDNHNGARRHQRTSKPSTNGEATAANGTNPTTPPPNRHPTLGEPTFWHEYTDTDGHLILYHCRFDPKGQKKQFRPLTWVGGRWEWKDPEGLLPLYGLSDLAAHPEKPVLLVEGEKTAEVAREMLPNFVITTWPHGGKSTGKVDWTPLEGRDVTCWPDADFNGTGIETMEIASEQMMKIGAKPIAILKLPEGLPDKWDLANVLPEDWTEDTVRELIEAAEPVEGRSPLGDPFGKLPAPPLPRGVLPPVIERFSLREAETMGVEAHGPAMAALAVCAGAISDNLSLRVKVHENWRENARLWIALIGNPSAKKSPVIRRAMAPLKGVERQSRGRYSKEHEEWEKTEKDERGPEPTAPRHVLNDTTIEAAGKVLAENSHGLLVERDELSGWFGAMDKYNGGKGAAADRGFWLQAWNGGPYTVDRASRGRSLYIPNLSISVLGGIQPDAIRRVTADAVDDGLLQRLLPVYLHRAEIGDDTPDSGGAYRDYDALIHRLTALHEIEAAPKKPFAFDADAQEIRRGFARYANDLTRLESLSPQFAAFCGKLDGLFARLSLVFHCAENVDLNLPLEAMKIPELVTEDTARRVERLMREFVIPHSLHFYLEVAGESSAITDARAIAGFILAHKREQITFGDLTTNVRRCRSRTREEVRRMIEPLEMCNWLEPDDWVLPRSWKIDPRVHQEFAKQAGQEKKSRQRERKILLGEKSHD